MTEPGLQPAVSPSPWLPAAQLPLSVRERTGAMETVWNGLIEGRRGLHIALSSALQTEQNRSHVSIVDADGQWGETVCRPLGATAEMHRPGRGACALPLLVFQGTNSNNSCHQLCNVPHPHSEHDSRLVSLGIKYCVCLTTASYKNKLGELSSNSGARCKMNPALGRKTP